MEKTESLSLLLVDDEGAFRHAAKKALGRRSFQVTDVPSGEEALQAVQRQRFDVVVLDLRMAGLDGIETLKRLRKLEPTLPVIILTGHGRFDDAVAGIGLRILEFIQKPVELDHFAERIRELLARQDQGPLRERTVRELMVAPSSYPRLRPDQSLGEAVTVLRAALVQQVEGRSEERGHRSAVVFDDQDRFIGMLRLHDVLLATLPDFLHDSPYASYFTGMFLAQTKVIGQLRVEDLAAAVPQIDERTPIMEAVHLMLLHHVINLPVMRGNRLVGILRDKDLLAEIAAAINGV